MKLMLITNSPRVARCAADSGVDRIFVDLEILGKVKRQGHLSTVISRHTVEDVRQVRRAVNDRELMVRVNPLNPNSRREVELVLDAGADLLMLPMFNDSDTVASFSELVAGRAGIIPLVETAEAARQVEAVSQVAGVSEVFIGLNDLHLSLGRSFMFELLAEGTVERLCRAIAGSGKPYGFGGIARIGEGLLPARLILGEHLRLGSQSVILSRTFFHDASRSAADDDFPRAVREIRSAERELAQRTPESIEADRRALVNITQNLVALRRRQAA